MPRETCPNRANRLNIAKEDVEKMIKNGNLDMITGIQNGLNKAKYNALNSLKGSFVAELTGDDGSILKKFKPSSTVPLPQARCSR